MSETIDQERLTEETVPLIFIRVRSVEQMWNLVEWLGPSLRHITGFVFPKFSAVNAEQYLSALKEVNNETNTVMYGMPILESPEVLYKETRIHELQQLKVLIDQYRDYVLNIRIGTTDLCGLYGIRRDSQTTIYEISLIAELIMDIVNLFSRELDHYVVSGPVWEHFSHQERILKPKLRQTPFQKQFGSDGLRLRKDLISKNFDGLIQETLLDKANGLIGKTIIHPSHLLPVQALHVVTHEEYGDALSIIHQANGEKGVFKSAFHNKMNEIKPHIKWAQKTLIKSEIYGVFHENSTFIDLLSEPVYS
ncbi:citrate lyase subunit beta [Bacillaceae bacterium SAOS 7]|nr:citrate lyase subunit beta [Bacillaceae bacterium SAOS 7]